MEDKQGKQEIKARRRLLQSILAFCKKYGYAKMVLDIEDKKIRIQHRWTPALERRSKAMKLLRDKGPKALGRPLTRRERDAVKGFEAERALALGPARGLRRAPAGAHRLVVPPDAPSAADQFRDVLARTGRRERVVETKPLRANKRK